MVVPGFIAEVRTHSADPASTICRAMNSVVTANHGMWARVNVLPRSNFRSWLRLKGRTVQTVVAWRVSLLGRFRSLLAGRCVGRLADAYTQPAAGSARRPGRLLPRSRWHGTAMALCGHDIFCDGLRYAVTATSLGRPVRGIAAAWIRLRYLPGCTLMAVVIVLSGRATVLYTFYPPPPGQRLVLFGRFVAGRRLDDLGRADDLQHGTWKRDNPRQTGAASDVRDHCDGSLWAWTASGCNDRTPGRHPSNGPGPNYANQRRPRAHIILGDAARHRLFLVDASIYRLL